MRLSTKLAIGLALTSAVILGSYGVWQLRREEEDLRRTAEHDFRLLGTAVQVGVENSMRGRKAADVRQILDALELRDSAVDVLVFDRHDQIQANSWGSGGSIELTRPFLARVEATRRPEVWFDGPGGLTNLIGIFPLLDEQGQSIGGVAVVWPLDELRRDLRATAVAATASSAALIIGITGVGWLLSLALVRRPMRALTEAMKRVEAGEWASTVGPHSDDEVGAALSEFDAMVRELAAARRSLLDAAEAREALEAGLQQVDKLVTIGQLSAGLAHEIGSPLQVLNGRARAIAARPDLPPDVRRSAQIVEEQSDRISRIVEQLLSVARRKGAQMSRMELQPAVRTIVELMEPEARRRHVTLDFRAAEILPAVTADGGQMQQVTMNLISNALHATPSGGIVRVELLAVVSARPGGSPIVRLTVSDTGPGISEPIRAQIFEPFFTAWGSSGGTGLGLAVVKSIVDEHGGTVAVTSTPGQGCCFTVELPVAGESPLEETA